MVGRRVEFRKQVYPVSLDPRIMNEVDKHVDPDSINHQSRSSVINEVLIKVFVEKSVEA